MDMSQYRELFVTEAREHLASMGELVATLTREGDDEEQINALFRAAHSVKGMASAMGYHEMATLAHRLEDVMSVVRKGELAFEGEPAALLQEGADLLDGMVDDIEQHGEVQRSAADLVLRLQHCLTGESAPAVAAGTEVVSPGGEPQKEPSVSEEERGIRQQTVRVKAEVLDSLVDLAGELVTTQYRFIDATAGLDSPRLQAVIADFSRLVRGLREQVSAARLIPFSTLASRFPRTVRELARSLGKEVNFKIVGGDMELDRGSLEALADPLVHLLRNAIDHGLEPPHVRQLAGKPTAGILTLSAERINDRFTVTLEDDGRGMDPARLIDTAIQRGMVTPEEGWSMTAEQAFMLILRPGFSTAAEVTDLSGRGVGMDSVRSTIQSLGGALFIESMLGKGTRMVIRLPLTIAIINVIMVEAGGVTTAIPATSICRTVDIWRSAVEEKDGRRSFMFEGRLIPLLGLPFGDATVKSEASTTSVVVAEFDGRHIGFAVDHLVGRQEVYVKPLGRPLEKLSGLSGSAVLGDGRVVFILDLPALARNAGC